MKILVTGGAGYIGSHTTLALLCAGIDVVVVDNLFNSSFEALTRVEKIANRRLVFVRGDVRDRNLLDRVFHEHRIYSVMHFAGLKSVSESVSQPLRYFDNNITGSQVLLQSMANAGVFKLIFSSSATVYGDVTSVPVSELCPVGRPMNPYGRSKLVVEDILNDLAVSDSRWCCGILRYFNPIGAHESGLIGEDPSGIPNNLLPYISQVAVGKLDQLSVFGDDYNTPDGTAIRDYIHVMDLAEGHLRALDALRGNGVHIWNIGTGKGYSVLEMLRAFEQIIGRSLPYTVAPRRAGDVAICYADPSKAELELGWRAQRGLYEMIRDAWHWQSMNPEGYRSRRH